jgi:hypothetical protein
MYHTGGLESSKHARHLVINSVDYVTSDKFKMMLRDMFVDWGTFQEVYRGAMTTDLLFNQVVKMLDLKDSKNKDKMLDVVRDIYQMSCSEHMMCIIKQFMLYEPMSAAIHSLFITIKQHFEELVDLYLQLRNAYIKTHMLSDQVTPDNYSDHLSELNEKYGPNTSSVLLLYIMHPESPLVFTIKGVASTRALATQLKKYKYAGFCPKVPHERITHLMSFPLNELCRAIMDIDPSVQLPDYPAIEKHLIAELTPIEKPRIPEKYKRQIPENITLDDQVKWYVDEILNLRKSLVPYGHRYEKYFVAQARQIISVNDYLKVKFAELHHS